MVAPRILPAFSQEVDEKLATLRDDDEGAQLELRCIEVNAKGERIARIHVVLGRRPQRRHIVMHKVLRRLQMANKIRSTWMCMPNSPMSPPGQDEQVRTSALNLLGDIGRPDF